MKLWIPVALGGLIVVAYAMLYAISVSESRGTSSIGIANVVGLVGVFVALIAAGFIMRRATPQR